MTLTEAAATLGVTPDTLRSQIRHGSLRAVKRGRDWHVTPREVERYRTSSRGNLFGKGAPPAVDGTADPA
jgi:excisionase family DNA binding protein